MPNQYLLKESRTVIELAATPFAGGGEGDLYKIKSPVAYRNYVAKLYHPHKISKEREAKTQYLIENPPVGLSENGSIVWIKDALYTTDYKFSGFIMPFAKGKKLELLCLGKLPKKIGKDWQRFDLKSPDAVKYRLRICFNLAAAIYQMHATDHYVLVDMKPENIIIQPNGLLAIVDTDSVEVIEDDVVIFPAPVATPEYTPPEFYRKSNKENGTIGVSWDRFGLAVIFYKLLCGIHPFAGSAKPPYDNLVSLHEKIEHGLFVHRKLNKSVFSVIPPPHEQFNRLDPNLQELFIQCFEEGHQNPEVRPTADEWCSALLGAIGDRALEAHFAHIMGLWGSASRIKIEMPSTLYRKSMKTVHSRLWLEQKIEDAFDSLPALPISLHQAIESGKQQVQLALNINDYVLSIALFFSMFFSILSFTSLGTWLKGDFWLSEVWLINLVAIVVMVSLLIVFPRLISGLRHVLSPERKVRKLWDSFRLTYPQLKRDVVETKRVLLERILTRHKKEIDEFSTKRKEYERPLKKYLDKQDVKVKALMNERKTALNAINEKYLKQTKGNRLFSEMKGRSVFVLNKRLNDFYQKKLNLLQQEAFQSLDDNYQKEKLRLKEKDTKKHDALMEEALCIFNWKHFYEKYLDGSLLEERILKDILDEHQIKKLGDIESMYWDKRKGLVLTPYREHLNSNGEVEIIRLTANLHLDLESFKNAYSLYQEGIAYAQKQDINYGKVYFQERYAPIKRAYEKALKVLEETYKKQRKDLQKNNLDQQKEALKEDLKAAQTLLQGLVAEEKEEVDLVEANYVTQYEAIHEESTEKVLKVTTVVEKLNEGYKMEVNKLLAAPNIEKLQISMKEKIQQAKKDIVKLERLKL
jgi:DNA-binding helix-hairpin-helix protein with protein kinase domain